MRPNHYIYFYTALLTLRRGVFKFRGCYCDRDIITALCRCRTVQKRRIMDYQPISTTIIYTHTPPHMFFPSFTAFNCCMWPPYWVILPVPWSFPSHSHDIKNIDKTEKKSKTTKRNRDNKGNDYNNKKDLIFRGVRGEARNGVALSTTYFSKIERFMKSKKPYAKNDTIK